MDQGRPWQKILDEMIVKDDAVGEVEWVISVDSSVVRAHQHAAGARKKGCTSESIEALKQFRDLATRYAKRTAHHQASLTIAAIIRWLR